MNILVMYLWLKLDVHNLSVGQHRELFSINSAINKFPHMLKENFFSYLYWSKTLIYVFKQNSINVRLVNNTIQITFCNVAPTLDVYYVPYCYKLPLKNNWNWFFVEIFNLKFCQPTKMFQRYKTWWLKHGPIWN